MNIIAICTGCLRGYVVVFERTDAPTCNCGAAVRHLKQPLAYEAFEALTADEKSDLKLIPWVRKAAKS